MAKTRRKQRLEKQDQEGMKKFIRTVGIITVLLLVILFFLFNGL